MGELFVDLLGAGRKKKKSRFFFPDRRLLLEGPPEIAFPQRLTVAAADEISIAKSIQQILSHPKFPSLHVGPTSSAFQIGGRG